MPIEPDNILIWSRSYDEYIKMFNLSNHDLQKKILGCADGASTFNKIAVEQGYDVTSCDPIYYLTPSNIRKQINNFFEYISPKIKENYSDFIWDQFSSPEQLCKYRLIIMESFLKDFQVIGTRKRYKVGKLPDIPFEEKSFDLALVGNFLFLYSNYLTCDFHIKSIEKLMSIASEIRIFPITSGQRNISPYLQPVLNFLEKDNVLFL